MIAGKMYRGTSKISTSHPLQPVAQHVHAMMAFDMSAARRDLPILAELQQANSIKKEQQRRHPGFDDN
eukprot:s5223_g1.t1